MLIEWDRYQIRLAEVGRSHWPRGVLCPATWAAGCFTDDHDLALITTGQGRMSFRDGWADLSPGVFLWLRPGWRYEAAQDPDNPLSMLFIHFDLIDSSKRLRPWNRPLPPERMIPPDPRLAEAITHRLVEDCFGYALSGYRIPPADDPIVNADRIALTGLLMSLDANLPSHPADPQIATRKQLLGRVGARILENPKDVPSIRALAAEMGYSVNHFIRLFKDAAGVTPQRFVIDVRLRRARQLLIETDMPVGVIAEELGYRDVFYFSKQFKQAVGSSPLRHRKAGRASARA